MSMRAYEINEFGIENLSIAERKMPIAQANEVVVRFHAASLNFRDLLMIKGHYNPKLQMPLVPFSDGAGEVVEVGPEVSKWKVGDRVMPAFMQGWIDGDIDVLKAKTALGGDIDGCLREYGTFQPGGLVRVPGHLTYEEAAALPCAGVTAWNALKVSGQIKAGDRVLLLGTGGVSIFGLQFAKNLGAETIITSSSDDKLEMATMLGADHTINYKNNPEWDKEVLEITKKRGVDHILEVGGAGTLQRSLNCVRMGGQIDVIGVLSGKGDFDPISVLMKAVRLQGIFVGSRKMFEGMAELMGAEYIKPVVSKVFEFEDARDALNYMDAGSHFGKIVVKISN